MEKMLTLREKIALIFHYSNILYIKDLFLQYSYQQKGSSNNCRAC